MVEDVLLGVLCAAFGFGGGLLIKRKGIPTVKIEFPVEYGSHVHRYDTMLRDGQWRCGICMEVKPN